MRNSKFEVPSLASVVDSDLGKLHQSLEEELKKLSGKTLLITGGAGFLGYYFVKTALSWNQANSESPPIMVTVFDNFLRGHPEWLQAHQEDPNITVEEVDLIQPLPADIGPFDYIVHAAGIASPIYYRKYPIECMDVNINGLRNLLDYSVKQGEVGHPICGFMFFSSSEIYGDPSSGFIPTPEEYRGSVSCTGPRACYDESKRYGETLCVNFAQQKNLPVTIARPFNNYGPGLKITDRRVIPDFVRNILNGKNIEMFSDGSPTRTFCYSADALSGYYKVLVRGQAGEAYNIGTETPEISIRQLAELLIEQARELFDYQGELVISQSEDAQYLIDNPNRRCPTISKARQQLDYNPIVSLEQGIRNSLIWYHHNANAVEA